MESESLIYAQVIYNYETSYSDELQVKAGEIIQVLYKIDENYVYAKCLMYNDNTHVGMVPLSYINFITIPAYLLNEQNEHNKIGDYPKYTLYVANLEFPFTENGDLNFQKGELIVSEKMIDENWAKGFYLNDPLRKGIFPINFVSIVHLSISNETANQDSTDNKNSLSQSMKQAKVIWEFNNEQELSQNKDFLRLDLGDYVLVMANLDEHWTLGENFKGEKGIFPARCIEYIQEENKSTENPILNRTQRKYTQISVDDEIDTSDIKVVNEIYSQTNDSHYTSNSNQTYKADTSLGNTNFYVNSFEDTQTVQKEDVNNYQNSDNKSFFNDSYKYCQMNFRFQSENEGELDCLPGEYLKLFGKIKEDNQGWIKCVNIDGKVGIVPLNYVTLLNEDSNAKYLFESQQNTSDASQSSANYHAYVNEQTDESILKSNNKVGALNKFYDNFLSKPSEKNEYHSYVNSSFEFHNDQPKPNAQLDKPIYKNSSVQNSFVKNSINNFENTINENERSRSSTPDSLKSDTTKKNKIKPPVPPKPKPKPNYSTLPYNNNASIIQNVNNKTDLHNSSGVFKQKPFNKEMQNNIKNLDSFFQKQPKISPPKTLIQENRPEILNHKESKVSSSDLSNMKNLFDETSKVEQHKPDDTMSKQAELISLADETRTSSNTSGNDTSLNLSELMGDDIKNLDEKAMRRKKERILSIKEAIDTENEYYTELVLCYEAFNNAETPSEFNKALVFENLKIIIESSKKLIDEFNSELARCDNKYYSIKFGECLIKSTDMKNVYAKYTKKHNDVINTIREYRLSPVLNSYMESRLETIKNKVRVASLETILIKPVQRIFKYPLFLTRIIENTDESHDDLSGLKTALSVIKNMLEYINEYKRKTDLLQKYLEQNDVPISEKMKKLNMKSITKKSNRITQQISNALGLYAYQEDESFKREESYFRYMERSVKNFIIEVHLFLNSLRDLLDSEKNVFTDLLFLFEDDFNTFYKFENSSNQRRSVQFQNYVNRLTKSVLNPLNGLVSFMHGPHKLISKRYDKLLDYQSALSTQSDSSQSAREIRERIESTKKDYEALNCQLLDDLPMFTQKMIKIFFDTVKCFFMLNAQFLNFINLNYKENIKDTFIDVSVLDETQKASLIIKLNNLNQKFNRQSLASPLPTNNQKFNTLPMQQSVILPTQTEEQRKKLLKKYAVDKLYVVTQKYVANEKLCQLNQNINDLIGLKIPYDPANQKHIWFVDNGDTEGFIPCSALTPYGEMINDNNLIDLQNETHTLKVKSRSSMNSQASLDLMIFNDSNSSDENKNEEFCIAMFDFCALSSNMMGLKKDEIYKVIEKSDKKGDANWWLVEFDNKKGYVPKNYLKLLE